MGGPMMAYRNGNQLQTDYQQPYPKKFGIHISNWIQFKVIESNLKWLNPIQSD